MAGEPPVRPVGDKALRAGIRLRRRRRAALAAIPVLAAATVTAVALATAAAPGRPAGIAPARPAAVVPHQFSPFIAYAAFGWLPAGYKLLEGGTTRGSTYQVAGPPSLATRPWYLLAYPADALGGTTHPVSTTGGTRAAKVTRRVRRAATVRPGCPQDR